MWSFSRKKFKYFVGMVFMALGSDYCMASFLKGGNLDRERRVEVEFPPKQKHIAQYFLAFNLGEFIAY